MGIFTLQRKVKHLLLFLMVIVIGFVFSYKVPIIFAKETIKEINFNRESNLNSSYNKTYKHEVKDPKNVVFIYEHNIEFQNKWYNRKAISQVQTSVSNCTEISTSVRIGRSSTSYHVASNSSGRYATANRYIRCAESYTTGRRVAYICHYNTMKLTTDDIPQHLYSSATWTFTR